MVWGVLLKCFQSYLERLKYLEEVYGGASGKSQEDYRPVMKSFEHLVKSEVFLL